MGRPFRPAASATDVRDQLARLRDGLKAVGDTPMLGPTATPSEVAQKLNELISRLGAITREGEGRRIQSTQVSES